jgi:hypothetical protein
MTKSEFEFMMIPPSYRTGNVPDLDPGSVNCQTRAAAPRAMHEFFLEKLRNPARDRCAGVMRQFPPTQLNSTRVSSTRIMIGDFSRSI